MQGDHKPYRTLQPYQKTFFVQNLTEPYNSSFFYYDLKEPYRRGFVEFHA